MNEIFNRLAEEFPKEKVSWRAQNMNKEGTSALALAYIDARDVMNRLDEVVGPANWQDRYEFHGPRTVCYLSVRVDKEWITKADGAGDSDVEAEKGAISDALKRAAVKFGIGRYLYDMEQVWAPCEHYEKTDDRGKVKLVWKKWKGDPWASVRVVPKSSAQLNRENAFETAVAAFENELVDVKSWAGFEKVAYAYRTQATKDGWNASFTQSLEDKIAAAAHLYQPLTDAEQSLMNELEAYTTLKGLQSFWADNNVTFKKMHPNMRLRFERAKDAQKTAIQNGDVVSAINDQFPGAKITNERMEAAE